MYDNEHYGEVIIDYTVLDSQFNKFVEYINMNHGTVEDMNEDFTIVTRPVYDELFLPVTDIYQKREIPKHVFQTKSYAICVMLLLLKSWNPGTEAGWGYLGLPPITGNPGFHGFGAWRLGSWMEVLPTLAAGKSPNGCP